MWLAIALLFAGPTFHADVEPILQRHCQGCHRPGEAAPMSLLTYAEARPYAKAIQAATASRSMPPWFVESSSHPLANDPSLTPAEIATLAAWANSGAAQGNPNAAPPPKAFEPGWNIPSPDLILEMPKAFSIPATGTVEYQYIIFPLSLKQDRWVQFAEARPGNPSVIHHAVAYIREPASQWLRGVPYGEFHQSPRNPGENASPDTRGAGAEALANYNPGEPARRLAEGQGIFLRAGSDVVLQIHYSPNGNPTTDRSRIGIVFTKGPVRERITYLATSNAHFAIPPGASDFRLEANFTVRNNARLYGFSPHMHLRGKAFEFRLVHPGGRVETLLKINPYRFHWQLAYDLAQPIDLVPGMRLECTAWYDNSANNKYNPDPGAEVVYGEQSGDEMMVGQFFIGVDPVFKTRIDWISNRKP